MPERDQPGPGADVVALLAEIARQNKVIQALTNRAERTSMGAGRSDFDAFQTALTLEREVRCRTADLEKALRDNERITRALRESEAKFRAVVNQPLVGISVIENGRFTFTNAKHSEIFGYTPDEFLGLGPVDLAAASDQPKVAEQMRNRESGEAKSVDYTLRGRRKDGAEIDIEVHGGVMELGEKRVFVSVVLDVSERMRAERETQALYDLLREQSIRDGLTALFNRRYLDASLERELILASRSGKNLSIVMSDLDHFKTVNDRYGHLGGDEVLRAVAAELMKVCRSGDLACRYGGEEFLLVLPDVPEAKARDRAEHMRAAVAAMPIRYDSAVISVTASFGVASFPESGKSRGELLAAADKALYAAKSGGRNQVRGTVDARPDGSAASPEKPASIESRPISQRAA